MQRLSATALFLAFAACSAESPAPQVALPVHIDPAADGFAYLSTQRTLQHADLIEAGPLDIVTSMRDAGTRNLAWLEKINAGRPENAKLRLTDPTQRTGFPIDKPNAYSPATIEAKLQALLPEVPVQMREVILEGSKPATTPLEVDDATYVRVARAFDRLYQSASRWALTLPYRNAYIQNRKGDIRGYYFLSRDPNLDAKLSGYSTLPADEQQALGSLLRGVCFNYDLMDEGDCAEEFRLAVAGRTLPAFWNRYRRHGERAYNALFNVRNPRRDLKWSTIGNEEIATLPFRDPQSDRIRDFLKLNLEDEWKWGHWKLSLPFTANADVRVVFRPAITPNVNGLGGNTITMDANVPVEEYEVQWIIRHEFGHVLGFPDCYVEFYDTEAEAMVNYQVDISDLMCSRAGNLLERHYAEMKRVYGGR